MALLPGSATADPLDGSEPLTAPSPAADAAQLRVFGDLSINTLRFIGTHNSYHQWPRLFGLPFLPIAFSPKHRYAHPPIAEQLEGVGGPERAVRQLEIDLHMRRFDDELRVMHLPWVDNHTSCKTLQICLQQVMTWSQAHDGAHAPILIWLEPKDDTPLDRWLSLGYYERVDLMRVEEAILEVVPRARILTPDDVRRGEPTLPAALARHGWPTLAELQGKLMFAVLDEDEHRDRYVSTHPDRNLTGRLMFVRSTTPSEPWAAMFKVNNAVPTLRDMQAFGRRSIEDPELIALQVYPEEEGAEGTLEKWWKNLWEPLTSESTDESEAGDTRPEPGAKPEPEPLYDRPDGVESASRQADEQPDAPAKDLTSEPKPETLEVDRRLRRELETVYGETRAEARERHKRAVAELEERVRLADAPESEELAIVLENARRSRAYRDLLKERLHVFIGENRKAKILGLVRDGFLVTTTADEPQENDAENRERAASTLLSAAQYVSTDALVPNRRDGYVFEFPGSPVRCNVLVDADECEEAIEGDD